MPRPLPHSPISAEPSSRTYVTRLAWVDRAKGIAILLVVLHHVIQFSAELQWASDEVIYCNTMLQTFRMPLFFAMSGLFFSRAASAPWRWLMVNRVLPFLYLYGIWTAIWSVAFEMAPIEGINFGLRHAACPGHRSGRGPVVHLRAGHSISLRQRHFRRYQRGVSSRSSPRCRYPSPLTSSGCHGRGNTSACTAWRSSRACTASACSCRLADRTTWVTVLIAGGVWGVGTVGVYLLAWPFGQYLFVPLCAAGIALGVSLAALLNRATVLGWFGRRTLPIYLLHQPLIGAVYSIDVVRSLPGSGWVVAGVLLCTWSAVVVASIGIWRVGRVIPGLFVAPWYGAGNATMSRASANAPRCSTGSRSPGDGRR